MSKKAVQVFRLEDRVLFEAGAVIQAAEAAAANEAVAENQADQSAENQESTDNDGSDAGGNAEDAAAQSEDSNSDDAAANVVLATEDGAEDANGAQDDIADFSNTTEQDSAENEIAFAESPLNTGDALPSSADEKVLVVINTTVNDSEAIVNDLGDNYEVLYLNSDSAALDQINAYLDANGNTQYSAIHFVTHGKDGAISLAGDKIDINTLNPADWKALGEHLTEDADILFYSCDLASSDEGKAFADAIANLTGADVAASTDTTGNAGDWDLEYQTGLIEEATLTPQGYRYRLETGEIVVNSGDDVAESAINFDDSVVTFREAIKMVNDNGGEYTIVFDNSVSSVNLTQGNIEINNDVTINGGNTYRTGQNAYGVELIVCRHPDEAGDPATEDMDNVKIIIANGKTLTVEGNLFISRYAGHGNDPELQGIAKKPTVDLSGGNVTISEGAGLHIFDNISIDTLANNGNLYLYGGTENGQTNSFTAYDADTTDDKAGSLGNVTYVHLNHSGYDGGWSSDTIELKMSAPNIIAGTYDTLTVRSAELLRDANWIRQVAYYGTSFSNSVDTSDTKGTVTALFEGTLTIDGAVTANKVVIDAGTTLDANAALTATAVENNGTLKIADTFTTNSTAFGNAVYDGTGTQNVAAGTYGDLTLTGGTKTLAGAVTSTGNFASSDTAVSGGTLTLNDAGTADAASSTISNTAFSGISVTNTATGSEGFLYVDKDSGNTISNTTGIKMVPEDIYSLVVNSADSAAGTTISFQDDVVTLHEAMYLLSRIGTRTGDITAGGTDVIGYNAESGIYEITFDSSVFTEEMNTIHLPTDYTASSGNRGTLVSFSIDGDVDSDGDADITIDFNQNNRQLFVLSGVTASETAVHNVVMTNILSNGAGNGTIFRMDGKSNLLFENVTIKDSNLPTRSLFARDGIGTLTLLNSTITGISGTAATESALFWVNSGSSSTINVIDSTISVGCMIALERTKPNTSAINFINSVVLMENPDLTAYTFQATGSTMKVNFYHSVTGSNVAISSTGSVNADGTNVTDATAAAVFGSNTLDSEGHLAIYGDSAAANAGALVGQLNGSYYCLNGNVWVQTGVADGALTYNYDPTDTATFGLKTETVNGTIYTADQAGNSRMTETGKYAAGSMAAKELASLVVTTTKDLVNAYDGVTSLREAVIYAQTLQDNNTVTFSTDVDWTTAGTAVTLDSAIVINGNVSINGSLGEAGNVTIQVKDTLESALDIYAAQQGLSDASALTAKQTSNGVSTIRKDTANETYTVSDYRLFEISGGTVEMSNMILRGGSLSSGNGGTVLISANAAVVSMDNMDIAFSATSSYGGAIFNAGNLTITDSVIDHSVGGRGGVLYVDGSTVTLRDVTIFDNTSTDGAIYLADSTSVLKISNSTIASNAGGGINAANGTVYAVNNVIVGNDLDINMDAGAIYAQYNVYGTAAVDTGAFLNSTKALTADTTALTGNNTISTLETEFGTTPELNDDGTLSLQKTAKATYSGTLVGEIDGNLYYFHATNWVNLVSGGTSASTVFNPANTTHYGLKAGFIYDGSQNGNDRTITMLDGYWDANTAGAYVFAESDLETVKADNVDDTNKIIYVDTIADDANLYDGDGTTSLREAIFYAVRNGKSGYTIKFSDSVDWNTVGKTMTLDDSLYGFVLTNQINIDGALTYEGADQGTVTITVGSSFRSKLDAYVDNKLGGDWSQLTASKLSDSSLKSGLSAYSMFTLRSGAFTFSFSNMTLQAGQAQYGAAIYKNNTGNTAFTLNIDNVVFDGGYATDYTQAGVLHVGAGNGTTVNITDTTFQYGRAQNYGGAMAVASNGSAPTVNIDNSVFRFNYAPASGGAIADTATTTNGVIEKINISNSLFDNNYAKNGGAIFSAGQLTVLNSTFTNNDAVYGGAIYQNHKGTVSTAVIVENSSFFNNSATTAGGAIYHNTTDKGTGATEMMVINSTLYQNTAGEAMNDIDSSAAKVYALNSFYNSVSNATLIDISTSKQITDTDPATATQFVANGDSFFFTTEIDGVEYTYMKPATDTATGSAVVYDSTNQTLTVGETSLTLNRALTDDAANALSVDLLGNPREIATGKYSFGAVNGEITASEPVTTEVTLDWTIDDSYIYNGNDQTIEVKALDGNGKEVEGLTVTLTYNDAAAMHNAGEYTVTATVNGLGTDYVLADGAVLKQTITVKQAELTVTVNNQTITAGEAFDAKDYTAGAAIGSDVVTVSGDLNIKDNADISAAGSYVISGDNLTIDNANYKLNVVPGTLTVEAAAAENVYSLVVNDADTTKDYVINFSDSKVTLTEALYIISNHSTLGITDLTTIEGYTDGVFNITFDSSVFTGEMSTVYLADSHENGSWSSQIVVMNGDVDGDGDADITVNTNNKVIVISNKNTTVKNLIFTGSTGKNIFNAYGGNIIFEDVTFTGNSGGGFLLYGGTASKTFINCTITDNSNTWLFQNNGGGDWNFINTTISTGDKGIYKPLSGTNSLNVNFINSIVLSDSDTALSDNATNSSFKFNFYKSVTNITTDKISTANKDLVTYTDSVVDAALTAADIFGSNTLDSEGILAIDGTGKAANGGTLVGKLNGVYYYLDGANWVKVGNTATTKAFDSAAANYGLGDGATVYTTGQNGGDRTIAMNYGKTYGINGVYNAGAYALDTLEERSLVVDNTADNINPFDGKTTLREAFIYAMESTGKTISFSDAVDWTNDNVITLDADLGTLHWLREKSLTIDGALKYNGTDQGRITIRVEHTLKDALLAYAEANGKTLDDLTAADVATVATDPNTVLTEHSIFDSTYLCTVKLSNLILEGGGSTAKDGGIINIGYQSHTHIFTNVLFDGAVAKNGGAVSLDGNYYIGASFTDTVFRFNYAQNGGAIYAACTAAGKPSVSTSNVLFDRNVAAIGGGALALIGGNATANILNTTFTGNQAASGGAIYQDAAAATGYLVTINTTFLNNTATYKGGAYRMDASSDTAPAVLFINSTFYGNREAADAANDVSTTGAAVHLLNSYYAAVSSDDATKTVDAGSSMKITDAAEQFTANGETLYHTYTKNNVTHTYLKPAHNTADGYQVVYDSTAKTVTAGESTVAITLNATMSAAINKDLTGANRGLATGIYSIGAVNGTYTPPVEVTLDWSAVENEYIYNGSNQTIEVKVLDGNGKEVEGLTVTLTYNDAAAMFNAGEYEIKVDTDALSEIFKKDYVLADGVETSKTITVKPAELKVKANDKTITAGEAVGELTYTVTGLFGSDNANITGALETTADGSTAGEYAITRGTLAIGNTNYVLNDADFTNGTLTVEANVVPDDPNRTVTTLDDTTVADDGLVSLREAIAYAKANGGGTITFASSLSGGTITLASSLTIDFTDSITIDGDINNDGTADITLSGNSALRILNISIDGADVTLEGLIFADGKATNGGALAVTKANVTLNISNSIFTGNAATGTNATTNGGGAIAIMSANNSVVTITGSTFSDNTSSGGGGAIYVYRGKNTTLNINDSIFENNTAASNGGGIGVWHDKAGASATNLYIDGSVFTGNTANGTDAKNHGGGGIYYNNSTKDAEFVITDTEFTGNKSAAGGGGIAIRKSNADSGTAQMDFSGNGLVFKNNTATSGAGMLIHHDHNAQFDLTYSLFDSNIATKSGGAIHLTAGYNAKGYNANLRGLTIINNAAGWCGGGIAIAERAETYISDSTIVGNYLTDNSTIGTNKSSGGNAFYGGAGIYVGKAFSLDNNNNPGQTVAIIHSIVADNYYMETADGEKKIHDIYRNSGDLYSVANVYGVIKTNAASNLKSSLDYKAADPLTLGETLFGAKTDGKYVVDSNNLLQVLDLSADAALNAAVNREGFRIADRPNGTYYQVICYSTDNGTTWKNAAGTAYSGEITTIHITDQTEGARLPYSTAGAAQYQPALMWSVADDGTVTKWITLADVVTQLQSDHTATAGVYYFTPSALDLGQITVNGSIALIGYSQDSVLDGTFVLDGTDNVTVDALLFTGDATVNGGSLTFSNALLSGNGTIAINSGLLNVVNTTVYDFSGTITIDGTNGLGQIVSSTIHSNSGTIAGNGKLNILNTIVTDTANLSGYTAKYSIFDIAGSGATNTYNVATDDIFGTDLVWNGLVLTTLAASSTSAHANGALTAINGTNLYYSTDGNTWYDFNGTAVSEDISSYVLKVDALGNQRIILNGKAAAGAFSSLVEEKTLVVTTSQDIVDEYDGYISLREAIHYATDYGITAADGTATITFDLAAIKAATGDYALRTLADGSVRIDLNQTEGSYTSSAFAVISGLNYTIDGAVDLNGDGTVEAGERIILDISTAKLAGKNIRMFQNSGGTLTLNNVVLYGTASTADGSINLKSSVQTGLEGTIFYISSGTVTLNNASLERSYVNKMGVIRISSSGNLSINGGTIKDNYGTVGYGNLIHKDGGGSSITITGTEVYNNTAYSSNANTATTLFWSQNGGTPVFTDVYIHDNSAKYLFHSSYAGAYSVLDSVISNNTFSEHMFNWAGNGGASTISGNTITNNSVNGNIFNLGGNDNKNISLQNNTISGNYGKISNIISISSTSNPAVYGIINNTIAGNTSTNAAFSTLYVANNRTVTLLNNIFADTIGADGFDIKTGGEAAKLNAYHNVIGSGKISETTHLPDDESNVTGTYAEIFGNADAKLDVANGVKTLAIDPESVAAYGGTLAGKIGNVFYYVSGGNWINAADGTTFGAFDSTDTTAYGLTNGTVYTTGSNGGDRLIATDYGIYNMGAHALTELLDNNLSAADKLIVNVQGDRFNPFDGKITFREAMDFVQKDTSLESYTVTFAENMQDAEIKLGIASSGTVAFALNGKTVTIDGTDRNIVLQIGGNGTATQIFSLTGGTKLTVNDITFRGSSVYTPADGETAATLSGSNQTKAIADMNNAQLTFNGGVFENFKSGNGNTNALIYSNNNNNNVINVSDVIFRHNNAAFIGSHGDKNKINISDVLITENLGGTVFVMQNTKAWNLSNVTVTGNTLTNLTRATWGAGGTMSKLKIHGNTFSGNIVEVDTGSKASSITVQNSTIANNSLASGKSVFYLTGGNANNLTLLNNTIANNAGGNGITVSKSANTVTMINNIVVGQINDLNVTDGTVNAKYNVYGINTGATLDKTNVESNMATEFGGTPDVNADGTLSILNTAKAAYTGTLTAVNGSNIYYVDNSNNYWYKMGGAATETFGLFVNDSTTNYGLTVEGAAVNTMAQNGTSRLTAADYITFNAGAYALDTLGTTGTVVTSVEDNRNVFDNVITLREAVLHANATAGEQTVTFASTLTSDTIQLTEDILITDDIVIDGTFGSGRITVKAAEKDRVFKINDRAGIPNAAGTSFSNGSEVYTAFDATIKNLNMTGGNIAGAGEVKSAATMIINTGAVIAAYQTNLTLENVSINGGNGVGIFTDDVNNNNVSTTSSLTFTNVTVENITGGRAVLSYAENQVYNNVVFRNNTAGAIENGYCGGAIIVNGLFEGNSAAHGGAIKGNFSLIENSTFINNTANMNGAAIHTSGNTLFNNVSVIGNTSKGDKGGAIFLGNGTYTMINCTIANNISQGTLDDNGAGYGAGAINTEKGNKPTLNLINTTVTGNQGVHVGGIDIKGGKLNLYNSIVAGNTTTGESLGDDIRRELGNSSITIQEVTAYNSVSSYFTDADAEEALDANGNFVWDLSGRAFLGELVSSTTPGGTYVKVAENSLLQNMNSSEVTVYTDAASGRITGIKVGDTQVYGNSDGTESKLAADQAGTDLLDGKVYTTIGSVAVEHKEIVSLTVTTGDDVVSGSDNKTSLREALAAAESGSPYTFGVLSDLGDGITFDAAVTTVNVADDLTIGTDISIDGGSGVTINVADGKTLAVAEDKTVAVEGTLALNGTAENNGTLNVADGAVLTVDDFTNNGSMSVTGDLAKTADGTFASGADSSVTYNGSGTTQTILSGEGVTYADLVIATTAAEATGAITAANITVNEDKSLTAASIETTGNVTANGTMDVSGAATVGGNLTANADVTVDGNATVSGNLTANADVTVDGNATVTDDLNANADVTVNGNMNVDGNTTIANGAALDANGATTDLGTVSNSGSITVSGNLTTGNAADKTMGDVTYDGADGQQIAAGMYDDLTVTAGSKSTSGDITVSGNADMNAALSTDDNVAFNGTVEGSGSVNATAGSVSYGENAGSVLGGTYNDVTVSGDAATTNNITVNGAADVDGKLSTDDNVVFNGTVSGSGSVNATAGSVSYGEAAGNVLGGTYNNVTVSGDAATTDAITVNGTADVNGKLSTDDNVAFNGTVSGDGSINATAGSVSYGEAAGNVLGGTYNDVTVSGDAATTNNITVNGAADVDGKLSTDDSVAFNGTVEGSGSINATAGSVSYGEAAGNVLGGTYNDVTVSGDATTTDNITVNGAADVDGKLSTDDSVAFNGAVSGDGSINATAGSVSYGENAGNVLGGTYNNVTVSGDAATTNNITVNGAADVDGKLSTDDNVAFNGAVSGDGSINATAGSVSYGKAAGNVLGGTYNNVTVSGDAATTNNITVNGAADVDGKLSTDDNVTFSGTVSGDGSINATAGSVSYNGTGDQTILNGSYNALALENGSKTLGGNVTVSAENGFSASTTTLKGATGATLTVNDTGNGEKQNSAITGTTFKDIVISNSATGGDGNLYINADGSTPNMVSGTVSGIRLVAELTVTAGAITYGDTMGSIILTVTNASGELLYKGTADELGWNWAAGNDAIENATENQAYSVDSGESTYYYNGDVNVVINKRVIQVKAQSYTITAGDALPKFLYSYIGELVGVDAFTGALICSGDGSAAGTYQILQGSLTLGDNYEIIFSAGTLTVEAAPESGKNAVNATQMPDQYNNIIMAEPDVTYQNRRDLHYLYGDACMIETFNGSVGKHYGYDPGVGLRGKTIVANTREIRLSHIVQKPGEGLMPIISTPDAEGNVRGGEFSDGETTMNFLRGGHTREEYEWDKVDFSDLFEAIDFDSISKNELFEDEVDEAIAEMTEVIA